MKGNRKNLPDEVVPIFVAASGTGTIASGRDAEALSGLLLWPQSLFLCPWGDPRAEGQACDNPSYLKCGEVWLMVGGSDRVPGEEVSHPTTAGATGRKGSDVVKHVAPELDCFGSNPGSYYLNSWSIFFLFSTSLRCN